MLKQINFTANASHYYSTHTCDSPVAGLELEEGLFLKMLFIKGATPYTALKQIFVFPSILGSGV